MIESMTIFQEKVKVLSLFKHCAKYPTGGIILHVRFGSDKLQGVTHRQRIGTAEN